MRPERAIGRILDQGRLGASAALALIVSVLLHASDLDTSTALPSRVPPFGPGAALAGLPGAPFLRWISFEPGSWLFPLVCVAALMVPAMLAVRALTGSGSFAVLMDAEYAPLINCVLMCWAAAYLPLAFARVATVEVPDVARIVGSLPAYAAINGYFAALAALSVRTVFGTSFPGACGITAAGWAAAVLGAAVFLAAGSLPRILLSPFLLYYAYVVFGPRLRSLGDTLRSRQQLRRQLEIATNNPRDADAHYQLGLIYQNRRLLSDAIVHFERAIQIDPKEADAHFQLGRIARNQGRFEEAVAELKTAAAIDDKLATSEVWRELGAACFESSRFDEAGAALRKYTERRPYDPEGLYWLGKTLRHLGRSAEARDLFERAVEAVATMPAHRRAQVRTWKSLAQAELRSLK